MDPKAQGDADSCRNCGKPVGQNGGVGRPRQYCNDACGKAYRSSQQRARQARTQMVDHEALAIAEQAVQHFQEIERLIRGGHCFDSLALLTQSHSVTVDLTAVVVQQARVRKSKSVDIAAALSISVDKLSRHYPTGRYQRSVTRRKSVPVDAPRARKARPRSDRTEEGARGAGADGCTGLAGLAGPDGPLTRALTHLHQASGMTLRVAGNKSNVTASYLCRILTGERVPSWTVTRRLGEVYGVDPADLHPLWAAARGYCTPEPPGLDAALRGLRLAAGSPTDAEIRRLSGDRLALDVIRDVFDGTRVPEWEPVQWLTIAVGGQPDLIRPLWQTARREGRHEGRPEGCATGAPLPFTTPTGPHALPAQAFG
ncbi:helix-turn-helix domain-containing protein [Streptomyces sp. 796.1]|uniref:helix-turn-helix domain-containing protein n=1 Tax=Streptomyces sp. 796.1 TaxID=3163029 RepID=UPI0039C9D839